MAQVVYTITKGTRYTWVTLSGELSAVVVLTQLQVISDIISPNDLTCDRGPNLR